MRDPGRSEKRPRVGGGSCMRAWMPGRSWSFAVMKVESVRPSSHRFLATRPQTLTILETNFQAGSQHDVPTYLTPGDPRARESPSQRTQEGGAEMLSSPPPSLPSPSVFVPRCSSSTCLSRWQTIARRSLLVLRCQGTGRCSPCS
jgi:hypothetical protein